MKYILNKDKNQKGYAILFAVVVISAISVIVAGLTNTSLKQVVLSSLAKDSQIAFYQADTASDCAFYAEMVHSLQSGNENFFQTNGQAWSCGGEDLIVRSVDNGNYDLVPTEALEVSNDPCFRISVVKNITETDPPSVFVNIKAKGYNVCNKNNPKIVEREIEINY
jgi:hypothetical protein